MEDHVLRRTGRLTTLGALLGVAAVGLVGSVSAFAVPGADDKASRISAERAATVSQAQSAALTTTAPAQYARQRLAWTKCFTEPPEGLPPGAERLECATMAVPLNWRAPFGRTSLKIAVTRLRPAKGTPRGTIFLNPGGPGAPGLAMPLLLLSRPAVANAYELVGFDVRGTGESTNITCGDMMTSTNDPRDRSRTALKLVADSTSVFTRHCDYRSGVLDSYVTTEQTVRDLDLLRHLLGWPKISWVGYSGGTWMGAWYATFFPNRVDRFVLDSNTEFTTNWQQSFMWQPLGFERRFRTDFAAWAAKYHDRFKLGRTPAAVLQTYERIRASLSREPLAGLGTFDALVLDFTIILTMYVKTDFQYLAETLAELREVTSQPRSQVAAARPSARLERAAERAQRQLPGLRPVAYADSFAATFNAVTCNDTQWTRSQAFWNAESARQGRKYPLVGWSLATIPCAYWNRLNVKPPAVTGRGVPPVLMVQSVRDPATPLEGAVRAHRRFAGSRMLTVTNEGDHGMYVNGIRCVDDIVDKFLLTGVLPARDVSCAGPGIPAPVDPEEPEEPEGPAAAARKAPPVKNPLLLNQRYTEIAFGRR
jgi:pimeloyl-ACP methyl ester carboxylesterase